MNPTPDRLRKSGHSSLVNAIRDRHGGMAAVRARLGIEIPSRKQKSYWKDFGHLQTALEGWINEHDGCFPNDRQLDSTGFANLRGAILKHHGGFPAVRTRMGYGPVTNALIAEHAAALARVIPALRPPDTESFWLALKSRWVARDLTEAIAIFEQTGSLERFRELLDV